MQTRRLAILLVVSAIGCGSDDRGPALAGATGETGPSSSDSGQPTAVDDAATGAPESMDAADSSVPTMPVPQVQDSHPGACVARWDSGTDGVFERVTTSTYDDLGRLVRTDSVYDTGSTELVTIKYDAAGNQTELRFENSNGTPFALRVETMTYDGDGNMLTRSEVVDGVVTSSVSWQYDGNGDVSRVETDVTGDGVADHVTTITREPHAVGVLVTKIGSNGSVVIELHDAAGNIVQRRTDSDGDGTFERVVDVTFDAAGYKVMSVVDTDGDGTIDERRTYDNDLYGNVLRKELDRGDDGMIDEISLWTYNEYGNVLRESLDTDADGTPDEINEWAYDDYGNMLRESLDADADGAPEEVTQWTYDDDGNLLKRAVDMDGDGTIDFEMTYDYACWAP